MKTITLILMLAATAVAAGDKPQPRLAFERHEGENDTVWIANLDGTGQLKIATGQAPELSPNGALLAFNTVQATGQPAHRKIAIADPATGKITVFNDVPSDNCMEPAWSPDAAKLLFTFYNKANEMCIGVMNADGTGFRDVLAGKPRHDYWAATWAPDGQSFFGEDMEHLYRVGLDGTVLKKWTIGKLIPKGGMSGDIRMHASRDGKTLLMDVDMDEKERKGWDGPPPSIWTLDLLTEKATRLTPKTLYASDCHWLDAGDILFSCIPAGEKDDSVWRMSVTGQGKDRKRLVKNASTPSAGGE